MILSGLGLRLLDSDFATSEGWSARDSSASLSCVFVASSMLLASIGSNFFSHFSHWQLRRCRRRAAKAEEKKRARICVREAQQEAVQLGLHLLLGLRVAVASNIMCHGMAARACFRALGVGLCTLVTMCTLGWMSSGSVALRVSVDGASIGGWSHAGTATWSRNFKREIYNCFTMLFVSQKQRQTRINRKMCLF